MKKKSLHKDLIIMSLFAFLLVGVLSSPAYAKKKLKITPKGTVELVFLRLGDTQQFKVNTRKKVKWSVKDKKIASISKKGKLKTLGQGRTTVCAKIGKKKISRDIYIYDNKRVFRASIEKEIYVGNIGYLKPKVALEYDIEYFEKKHKKKKYPFRWETSNPNVAKVVRDKETVGAYITGTGPGRATISLVTPYARYTRDVIVKDTDFASRRELKNLLGKTKEEIKKLFPDLKGYHNSTGGWALKNEYVIIRGHNTVNAFEIEKLKIGKYKLFGCDLDVSSVQFHNMMPKSSKVLSHSIGDEHEVYYAIPTNNTYLIQEFMFEEGKIEGKYNFHPSSLRLMTYDCFKSRMKKSVEKDFKDYTDD